MATSCMRLATLLGSPGGRYCAYCSSACAASLRMNDIGMPPGRRYTGKIRAWALSSPGSNNFKVGMDDAQARLRALLDLAVNQ